MRWTHEVRSDDLGPGRIADDVWLARDARDQMWIVTRHDDGVTFNLFVRRANGELKYVADFPTPEAARLAAQQRAAEES